VEHVSNIKNDQYTTIRAVSRTELRVKKSKFIGLAKSVATEQDVMDFIRSVKAEFPNATHYCYAFNVGFGAKKLVRSSDAGEPANSAGKPILSAIESSGFHNVICVVVRYFGGIKLGIGGLIRAYGRTARDCLKNAATVVYIPSVRLQIEIPYAHIGAVVNLVARLKGRILSMNHGEKTTAVVCIRCSMVPPLKERIRAISGDIKVRGSYCEIHQNT
jgi:uncharacterized YigZ family protein